jgi:ankyrin repeat protein
MVIMNSNDEDFAKLIGLANEGRWAEISSFFDDNPELMRAQDSHGETVLHKIAMYGAASNAIDRALLNGVDVNAISLAGVSALGVAISGGHKYGLTTLENIRSLVNGGARLNIEAQNGFPPLLWAVHENKPEIVNLLIEYGASPFEKNSYGDDAFRVAKDFSLTEIAAILQMAKAQM